MFPVHAKVCWRQRRALEASMSMLQVESIVHQLTHVLFHQAGLHKLSHSLSYSKCLRQTRAPEHETHKTVQSKSSEHNLQTKHNQLTMQRKKNMKHI